MRLKILLLILALAVTGFVLYKIFRPIKPAEEVVQSFDVNRYTGKWYEIARLDFHWEKGLSQVTAEYTLNPDGSIKVNNQGFDSKKNKWKQSIGKARSVNKTNEGALKVSFFGPFYSGYNVVKIDSEYKYALIFGEDTDNMWILSREKTIPEEVKQDYLGYAEKSGYNINDLVWTVQN